jgi:hypothetical protein
MLQHSHACRSHSAATHMSRSSCPGAGSGVSLSLLLLLRGVRVGYHGMNIHHGDEAGTPRTMEKPSFLVHQMLKWFYDTFTGTAIEQPIVVLGW